MEAIYQIWKDTQSLGYNDLYPRMGCSGLKTERVPKADQAALNKATIIGGLMVVNVSPVLRCHLQVLWAFSPFYA